MTTSFDDSTWRKKNSLKSKGLELEQARKLCSRLYYKGACGELEADRILLSPYQQVQHVLRSKELTALRKEMGDLLQEIPSPDGFIPRAFINANPALKRGVESMQKDVCLHERFQLTDKGLKCHSSWTQGNYCEAPLSSSKRDPRCTDQGRKRLDNWVTELVPIRNELHPLQSLVNLSEKDSYLIPLQNLTTAMNSPLFIGLTGKLKAAQLLKVLNRHYPAASKRNCETANQWDIYGLLQTLDKIPKEPKVEEPKCD